MKKGKFYITTPIYYVNDVPHIGHAYTTIAADIIARWHRLLREDVFFLTGTDEHGQKVEEAAKAKGMKPQLFVNSVMRRFKEAWKMLNISNDFFIRTTSEKHKAVVQKIVKKMKKDIYRGVYEGQYCIPCESYWTKSQLIDGKCPECGRETGLIKEDSYFFKLSKYRKKLLELYKKNPQFIMPFNRKEEIISRVKEGLQDLSITRTTFRWGVPFPLNSKHICYVWIDALINYLSALNYPDKKFKCYWPADVHLIGKEILWFHAVIWPAMLMAAGLPLPKQIFAHGWMTINGEKMSKSKGNFIPPKDMVMKYGVDGLRYFLMRSIPFGQDGDFNEKALKQRYNTELADKLGNLVSRVVGLAEKFLKGKIPQGRIDDQLVDQLQFEDVKKHMAELELDKALALIFAFVDSCNLYIQEKRPWDIPWEIPPEPDSMEKVSNILYTLIDSLRVTAILLSPFMPETAEKIARQLGVKLGTLHECKFGLTKATKIKKGPVLFEKIKVKD